MSLFAALWIQSFSHFSIHLTVCLSRPYFQPGVCPDCPWPSSCYPSTQAPLVPPIACQTQFQLGFGFCVTSSPAASPIPWSLQPRQPLTVTRPNKPLLVGGWEVQWSPSVPDPPGFLVLCHTVLPAHATVVGSPPQGPRHQQLLFPVGPVSLHCSTPSSQEPLHHTSVFFHLHTPLHATSPLCVHKHTRFREAPQRAYLPERVWGISP